MPYIESEDQRVLREFKWEEARQAGPVSQAGIAKDFPTFVRGWKAYKEAQERSFDPDYSGMCGSGGAGVLLFTSNQAMIDYRNANFLASCLAKRNYLDDVKFLHNKNLPVGIVIHFWMYKFAMMAENVEVELLRPII